MELMDRLFFWSIAFFAALALALNNQSFVNDLPDFILFIFVIFGSILFMYALIIYPVLSIIKAKNDVNVLEDAP